MKRALLTATAITMFTTGCATVISGSTQTVQIKAPEGAKIAVLDNNGRPAASGVTELTADLPRGTGYWRAAGYQVKVSQPGYKAKSVDILPAFNPWYLLTLTPYIGIIGGLIVDPLSGAFYTFDKDRLDITLDPVSNNVELANRIYEAEQQAKTYPVSRHDYTARQAAKAAGCLPLASPKVDNYNTASERLTFQCVDGKNLALTCSGYTGCVTASH
ncbi:hypothetical protein GBK02_08710 [Dechloromonas sp. TW-R-39-2]|uniref:hypothetical protein n=1 Tax=Dechloromonas sp. TW-R-39-2 TaxID=2654218 RepID=UPI00193CEAFB|nr:hypothetical protein [Dechloromonas sp. TW-R-39-2]QRM19473.1 hypothetical protein GBK02_08710 [Dechloromonas sp. TW-R-39-2]